MFLADSLVLWGTVRDEDSIISVSFSFLPINLSYDFFLFKIDSFFLNDIYQVQESMSHYVTSFQQNYFNSQLHSSRS